MNRNWKTRQRTPLMKCRTKKIKSNRNKAIQGTFIATLSFKDISDETSAMDSGDGSWITSSERSIPSEEMDDVFLTSSNTLSEGSHDEWSLTHMYEESNDDSPNKGTVKETFSPTETFRRSEGTHDKWSLTRVYEDSIDDSPNRGSEELKRKILCSTRIENPEFHPISPHFEDFDEISSIPTNMSNNAEAKSQYNRGRETKLPGKEKPSKRYTGRKVFTKRRNKAPQVKTIKDLQKRNSIEIPIKLSKLNSANLSPCSKSKEILPQASEDLCETPKVIVSEKSSGRINFPKVKRKEASQIRKNEEDVLKRNLIEVPSALSEMSPNLCSANVAPSSKSKEYLPEANNKDKECETPKVILSMKSSGKINFPKVKRKLASQVRKRKTIQEMGIVEVPSVLDEMPGTLRSVNLIPTGKSKEDLPQTNNKDFCETPHVKKDPRRKILDKVLRKGRPKTSKATVSQPFKRKNADTLSASNRDALGIFSKSTQETPIALASELVKRKKKPKGSLPLEDSLEEEAISTPSASTTIEDSFECMDTADSAESRRTHSKNSVSSSYMFLEEIGMLESDVSINLEESKKESIEDSWEKKSLSEKLREYEKYLQTIPICDLSLKKWRIKEQKHKG